MRPSGLVLAGGEGRRMGAPKALVPFRGAPLVTYAALAMMEVADEVIVALGQQPAASVRDAVGCKPVLLADRGGGPIAGFRAGARVARGEWLLVAPVDAPLVSARLLRALLHAAQGREGAVVRLEGRPQPLVAAYRTEALRGALRAARLPRDLPEMLEVAWVDDPPLARQARDADTPEELDALARELTLGRGAR